jgi:16S rRNA (guanine966-N2)-methyltransferase
LKNELRIIGGRWRSRKIRFPEIPGLRPTPDRVRETLFNWLRDDLDGARCLDLYAGSGALGLEAISRGAARTVLVERDARACAALQENLALLAAGREIRVVRADVERFLRSQGEPFDLVFLDPPFHKGLVANCCELLERGGWLTPSAKIYVEIESNLTPTPPAIGWNPLRSGTSGEVGYHLFQRRPPADACAPPTGMQSSS